MSLEYQILRAEQADIREILCMQHIAYQSEAAIYNNYSIQPLTQTLEQAIEEFNESIVLKAVLGGKIIGSVRAAEKEDSVYIGKLMVLPEFQNKGIGKRLLQAIEDAFCGKRYWLTTGDKSKKNLQMYEKAGYSRFKTEEIAPGLMFVYLEKHAVYVREIIPADYTSLEDFIYHAIFVPPGAEAPPREIIFEPDVFIYIKDFGDKDGDCGVIAEQNGKIVGAAWTRIIPAYGHIDDETPELAISVLPEHRGQNTGTVLMTRLFELLRERGYKQSSLAVQKKNPAVRFYHRLGYKAICEKEEEFIMVKELGVGLREWSIEDAADLTAAINNKNVLDNLRD